MEREGSFLYEFERFRLDPDERVLIQGDSPVPLAPKVLEILLSLVERAGHVVSKEELMESVWADAFVEESNLTQSIFVLRKALGETKNGSRFIETVPRRGYRFVCPVKTIRPDEFEVAELRSNDTLAPARVRSDDSDFVARPEPQSFSQKWKSFFAPIGLFAVFLIVIGLATNNFYRSKGQDDSTSASAASAANLEIRRLTADSRAYSPAISPDGRLLAYKHIEEDMETVWLKDLVTGSDVQIRPPTAEGYSGLLFSPDARELYYRVDKKLPDGSKRGVVVSSPVFGGIERKVAEQPWTLFALSQDGRQLAFVRALGKPDADRVLLIVDTVTGAERTLAKSEPGRFIFKLWGTTPSWSPDDKRVVVCGRTGGDDDHAALFEVRVEDGAVTELAAPRWHEAFQTVWLADGTGLLVVARERPEAPFQIWRLSYPSGEAVRVTNDLQSYGTITYSANSNTLIAQQEIWNSHIWVLPETDTAGSRQLTSGTNVLDGTFGLAWMPDGRIIFSSNRAGEFDLWTVETDGSELRQLTANNGANKFPRVSGDGRHIVFVSNRAGGKRNLWRMNIDGSQVVQLTHGDGETLPSISPDSQSVFYTNGAVVPSRTERVSIDGNETSSVPNESFGASGPVISPDGKLLAYYFHTESTGWRTGILPVTGGKTIKALELQGSRGFEEWTPDSRALIYIKPGFLLSNIWRESLDGRQIEQVTYFKDSHIYYFAFSPDHRHLALARGDSFSDIVLIENFR
jgi:Tol biopolymer transport system component/DNA-binding winged helix-turn-helix (wHTH) protein